MFEIDPLVIFGSWSLFDFWKRICYDLVGYLFTFYNLCFNFLINNKIICFINWECLFLRSKGDNIVVFSDAKRIPLNPPELWLLHTTRSHYKTRIKTHINSSQELFHKNSS